MSNGIEHSTAVYSVAQVRMLDRAAIEHHGIEGYELMTRAAKAALAVLRARWPGARQVLIYCGAGNNAGDGYVLARLAQEAGLSIVLIAVTPPEKLSGDAARAWVELAAAGLAATAFDNAAPMPAADVLVDALLGTGLDRPLEGPMAEAVARINASGLPVLALDVPTGLNADTGFELGSAVRATATVTFVGLKTGLYLGLGGDFCGDIEFFDLGMADLDIDVGAPPFSRLNQGHIRALLPPRPTSSHKGSNGRVLLIGGGPGMAGAIRLAAEACLRAGAGLVYVATHPDNVSIVVAGRPEIICRSVEDTSVLDELAARSDVVVVGPGIGRSPWAQSLVAHALQLTLPVVADADALNIVSQSKPPVRHNDSGLILTPHPGEAARLLQTDVAAIEHDRLGAVRELAERFAAVAVLKGSKTLVAGGGPTYVCDRGNPGMATAGMGDVLSGVIAGVLAQTGDVAASARAGVLLHALAGDDAAEAGGERGLIASDLMPFIRRRANP